MNTEEKRYFERLKKEILPRLPDGRSWLITSTVNFDSKESYEAGKPESAKVEIITDGKYWTIPIMLDNPVLTDAWKERWGLIRGADDIMGRAEDEAEWSSVFRLRESAAQTEKAKFKPERSTLLELFEALADSRILRQLREEAAEAAEAAQRFVENWRPYDHVTEIEDLCSAMNEAIIVSSELRDQERQ